MRCLLDNDQYVNDVRAVAEQDIPWEKLQGATVVVTGASGMIGSFLIDVLLTGKPELDVHIIAFARNEGRARQRFAPYLHKGNLEIVLMDINKGMPHISLDKTDYVIHAASNTHPRAYATEPIKTLLTNVIGTENMLKFGMEHSMKRFLFVSSVEIY